LLAQARSAAVIAAMRSMEKQVEQHQYNGRNAQQPRNEVFAHDVLLQVNKSILTDEIAFPKESSRHLFLVNVSCFTKVCGGTLGCFR
jgi:hypothetical protein